MVCPSCGRRIPRKSQYCLHCGASAAAFKSAVENGDGSPVRTCILCGAPLPEDSTADVCERCLSGQTPLHPTEPEPELHLLSQQQRKKWVSLQLALLQNLSVLKQELV